MGNGQCAPTRTSKRQAVSRCVGLAPVLVSAQNFLLATRDAGYRSTASAIAEFIDNSIQAGARRVTIEVLRGEAAEHPIEIIIADDGGGMSPEELSQALTFGGSGRFGDRSSLGRYGMGLPNAALSRARRAEVYSWTDRLTTFLSTIDIDSMAEAKDGTLPAIVETDRPGSALNDQHGTVVHLRRCDRLEYRRASTIARKLHAMLSRTYRLYIENGLNLFVNGRLVCPLDPLFLHGAGVGVRAAQFGDDLTYGLTTDAGKGQVRVRFSELPVEEWHDLPAVEKRRMGITGAANVSILRAGREVAAGWWFMGKKRRQNYDDWWRCEVSFDPALDDLFGITHTKQQVNPSPELIKVLARDLEPVAHALNTRVRRRFELVKMTGPLADAARTAAKCAVSLSALPGKVGGRPEKRGTYELVVGSVNETSAFDIAVDGQDLSVTVNERHPLYRDLLAPLAESGMRKDRSVARDLALMLLALARAEVHWLEEADREQVAWFRKEWSDVAAVYLNS